MHATTQGAGAPSPRASEPMDSESAFALGEAPQLNGFDTLRALQRISTIQEVLDRELNALNLDLIPADRRTGFHSFAMGIAARWDHIAQRVIPDRFAGSEAPIHERPACEQLREKYGAPAPTPTPIPGATLAALATPHLVDVPIWKAIASPVCACGGNKGRWLCFCLNCTAILPMPLSTEIAAIDEIEAPHAADVPDELANDVPRRYRAALAYLTTHAS